jgi:hypothetical protein
VKHELPSGSKILVTTDGADTLIAIPHPSAGPMRFATGLFLLAWLGGWAVGLVSALSALMTSAARGGVNAFLVFWLVGWTLAGLMAMYWVYRSLRPSVPESLRLTSNGVVYDSGVPPPSYSWGYSESASRAWRSMYPKRTRVEIDRRKLQSLRLRETCEGNRLTIDADATRIEIGKSASEIEREWLYQALVKRYSLRPPAAGTGA